MCDILNEELLTVVGAEVAILAQVNVTSFIVIFPLLLVASTSVPF